VLEDLDAAKRLARERDQGRRIRRAKRPKGGGAGLRARARMLAQPARNGRHSSASPGITGTHPRSEAIDGRAESA